MPAETRGGRRQETLGERFYNSMTARGSVLANKNGRCRNSGRLHHAGISILRVAARLVILPLLVVMALRRRIALVVVILLLRLRIGLLRLPIGLRVVEATAVARRRIDLRIRAAVGRGDIAIVSPLHGAAAGKKLGPRGQT